VPIEKSWGPDYIRFGLNMATDFRFDSSFNLRALYRKTWLNPFGGEWLAIAQLGTTQALTTQFYQPVDYRQRWFVQPYATAQSRKANLYFDGERLAEYRVPQYQAGIELGANLGTYGQARVGWQERKEEAHLEVGSPLFPDAKSRTGALTANISIDQYNYAFFPTRGYKIDVDYFDARRVEEGPSYARVEARASAAFPVGPVTVIPSLAGGRTVRGSLPVGDLFSLGGLARLSAFSEGQILGERYSYGSVRVEHRLLKTIPVINLSVLAGINLERARMSNSITEPNLKGNIDSYGFYLGATTPLGPLYIGWSGTQDRRGRIYFFLGTP